MMTLSIDLRRKTLLAMDRLQERGLRVIDTSTDQQVAAILPDPGGDFDHADEALARIVGSQQRERGRHAVRIAAL